MPNILKDQRKKLKLTQKEAADRIGIKQSHLSYYENKKFKPRVDMAQKIADALELSTDKVIEFFNT